jgi:uncharacterized repeat protein (TIGR01451 family)
MGAVARKGSGPGVAQLRLWLTACVLAVAISLLATPSRAQTCGIPGAGGAVTASGAVNTYYAASGTASGSSLSLGAIRPGGGPAIAAGDMVLVMQMQGTTIDSSDTNQYGNGAGSGATQDNTGDPARGYTGTPTAGRYEYKLVTAVSGSLISFSSALINTYTQAAASASQGQQTYQVIRVPQYASLAVSNGAPVVALPWNGSTGGVVAIDVTGTTTFTGGSLAPQIDVSGRGFRGGGSRSSQNKVPGNAGYRGTIGTCGVAAPGTDSGTSCYGGLKGEGVAGTPRYVYDAINATWVDNGAEGYPGGDGGRGAPANAGGGGNQHNSGGGGGGNGGIGGQGGFAFSGDGSRNVGGFGGSAFPQSGSPIATQLVMGGGGGAADINNASSPSGSGGSGGGVVLLRTGAISGAGLIRSNGTAGLPPNDRRDSGGGGGAGGTVLVTAGTGLASVAVQANGGVGGDANVPGPAPGESEGPGGGGGGGVVVSNGALGTVSVSGAVSGTSLTTGTANGATTGISGPGTVVSAGAATGPGLNGGSACLPALTVTKSTSTPNVAATTGGIATYTVTVSNAAGVGGAQNVELIDSSLPPGWTLAGTPTYVYSPSPPPGTGSIASGAETTVNGSTYALRAAGAAPGNVPAGGSNASLNWNTFFVASGGSVAITYTVSIPDTAAVGLYHNDAGVSYTDPTRSTAGRKISPAINNTANRPATAYSANTTYQTGQLAGQNVPGSNYSGLDSGPTGEDVRLQPDLSAIKTGPAGPIGVGTSYAYNVTARNNGRAIGNLAYAANQATPAINGGAGTILTGGIVRVTDTVPAGLTIGTVTAPAGWSCTTAGQLLTCDFTPPSLPLAAAADLPGPIIVNVTPTVSACPGPASNSASVVSTVAAYPESNTANNTSAAVSTALSCVSGVSVTKSDGKLEATIPATNTYTITVLNAGPASADNTVLRDPAAAGLSCTVAPVCAVASGSAVCPVGPLTMSALQGAGISIPTLPANSSLTFTVTCSVTASGS